MQRSSSAEDIQDGCSGEVIPDLREKLVFILTSQIVKTTSFEQGSNNKEVFYHHLPFNDVDAANPSHSGDHLSDRPTDTEVRISCVVVLSHVYY
jgi:hypothetical protein